jgi:hypothetical protein
MIIASAQQNKRFRTGRCWNVVLSTGNGKQRYIFEKRVLVVNASRLRMSQLLLD